MKYILSLLLACGVTAVAAQEPSAQEIEQLRAIQHRPLYNAMFTEVPSQRLRLSERESEPHERANPPFLDDTRDPGSRPWFTPVPATPIEAKLSAKPRVNLAGETVILRNYEPGAGLLTYNTADFPLHCAFFKLDAPAYVRNIRIALAGTPGNARVRLFGQDGGTSLPESREDLTTPMDVSKTLPANEVEWIDIPVSGDVRVFENYFYIGIDQFSSGLATVSDDVSHEVLCNAPSQATSVNQYFLHTSGQIAINRNEQNEIVNTAFLVEVTLEYQYDSGQEPQYYVDVTESMGIDSQLLCRSASWGDYNGDGHLDFMVAGVLYRNDGATFTDVSTEAGIDGLPDRTGGQAFVDMNNDGLLDIVFLSKEVKATFINNGDETFSEQPLEGMPELKDRSSDLSGMAFADIDFDGLPDMFLSQNWEIWPSNGDPVPSPNYFFLNDGGGGFVDITDAIYPGGAQDAGNRTHSRGGARWIDYDNDGDLDLYVINYVLQRDELYRNNGDGSFTNVIDIAGIDINSQGGSAHGTGGEWGDYDNDGDMDLLVTQTGHVRFFVFDHRWTTIYKNVGVNLFLDQFGLHGLRYEDTWGSGAWGDMNNDGLLDIYLPAFYGCRYPAVYEQRPDHTFEYKTYEYGFLGHRNGAWATVYSATFVDFDRDGRLDIMTADDGRVRLFRNVHPDPGNYVALDLRAQTTNKFAIGARAHVYIGEDIFTQDVTFGNGVRCQRPARLHYGLGEAAVIDSVVITWPTNPATTETFYGVPVNSLTTITQGEGISSSVDQKVPVKDAVRLYPNPVADRLTVKFDLAAPSRVSAKITDALGSVKHTLYRDRQLLGPITKTLDINAYPAGMYLLQISIDGVHSTHKFVKN